MKSHVDNMNLYQNRYNDAHPKITLRVDPEIKDRLRRLGDENGKTMSEVTEDMIIDGLNGNNNVEKPGPITGVKKPVADVKKPISDVDIDADVDLNAVIDDSFNEGYAQGQLELKDDINSKLNGFKNSKKEKEFSCDDCGFEFDEKNKFCPSCGIEFEDAGAGSDKKSF
ncbi:unnamed protein product, partial [marine sediment metagenome]